MSGLFAAIRRGKVKPGMAEEFAKRVKAGALPVGLTDFLYQRDGAIIAFARPDLAVAGSGLSSAAPVVDTASIALSSGTITRSLPLRGAVAVGSS